MPSMREKKRYIAFKAHSESSVNYNDVRNSIWNSVEAFLGDDDSSRADIKIVKNVWNQKQQTGLIRCTQKYADRIKLCLAFISQIGDSKVIFQATRVSGTIKGSANKQ